MRLHREKRSAAPLDALFLGDRRDRHPGTHFASELGSPKPKRKRRAAPGEAHVDEDLGCSAFGIDLPFLRRF